MPGRAVIPDRDCPRLPLQAACIARSQSRIEQLLQQRHALLSGLADKVDGEAAIYIKQLAACLRVADDNRMHSAGL